MDLFLTFLIGNMQVTQLLYSARSIYRMLDNRQAILSKYRTILKGLQSTYTRLIEQMQKGALKTKSCFKQQMNFKRRNWEEVGKYSKEACLVTDDTKGSEGEMKFWRKLGTGCKGVGKGSYREFWRSKQMELNEEKKNKTWNWGSRANKVRLARWED